MSDTITLIKSILITMLFLVTASAESSNLSKQDFTKEFVKVISAEIKESDFVVISNLEVHTNNIGGYELDIYLDNTYDTYTSGSRSLQEAFNDQINSIRSQQAAYSNNSIKTIFPVLKPKSYLEIVKKQLRDSGYDKDGLPFYLETLNSDIYIMYVFDTPESMRFVSREDIEKLNIETSLVRSIATKNLDDYYHKIGAQLQQLDTGGNGTVYMFTADENYEASVLISTFLFDKVNFILNGEFVVFVPARNTVLIVPSQDTVGIKLASKLALQGYSELGYSISPYAYKRVLGVWQRIMP